MAYSAVVLADTPVAYWRLGDSGATAADATGNGHTGTLHNGVITGDPGAIAVDTDTAMTFNGTNQSIDGTSLGITGSSTFELWARIPGTWPAGTSVAFSPGTSASGYLGLHNTRGVFMQLSIGGTARQLAQEAVLSVSDWHHAVGTWDGTNMRVYADGVLANTSANFSGALSSGGVWQIGTVAGAAWFPGSIDEVAIYSSALSPTSVLTHFNAGRGMRLPLTLNGSSQTVQRASYY